MSAQKQVAVILAPGFEETEAVAVIDVLRRAGAAVTLASLDAEPAVAGSHGIRVAAERPLAALDAAALDAVVLPGGMPGSEHLARHAGVLALVRAVHGRGGLVAAICAAPIVLQAAGLLAGRRVTSHPSRQGDFPGAEYSTARVVIDERILTSRGPGTALEFGLALAAALGLESQARELRTAMLIA